MMKVQARHWVNYNGVWHKCGEAFEINDADAADILGYVVEIRGESKQENSEAQAPAKRGRKRKSEE